MTARSAGLGALLLGLSAATTAAAAAQAPVSTLPTVIDWPTPITAPGLLTHAVLPFAGGLVAVGQEQDGVTSRATAWWSADGSAWERTLRAGPTGGYTAGQHVVAMPTALLVMGPIGVERCTGEGEGAVRCEPSPVAVWRSVDGRAWERVRAGIGRGAVVAMAARPWAPTGGPLGVLAVGTDRYGYATTWRSAGGLTWSTADLTGDGFDRAGLRDVAATPEGWVMVGSTGGRDVPAGGVMTPNGSTGAAWTSVDGVTWQPAVVDGTGEQVELRKVFVGSDGLVAVGTLTGGQRAEIWTSIDGTAWTHQAPSDGVTLPIPEASDGTWIVGTSYRDHGAMGWWVSTDGSAWTELASSGEVATVPRWDGGVAADVVTLGGRHTRGHGAVGRQ